MSIKADNFNKLSLGFWIYLMTDLVIFVSLFSVYAVLHGNVNGGPAARDLFSLPYALIETLFLLTSTFTCGLAVLALRDRQEKKLMLWLFVTFILGLAFLTMEVVEFVKLVGDGYSWSSSAFLSAFFTLVGAHGLHILVGLIWLIVLVSLIVLRGLNDKLANRVVLFSLFWHFLDIIWIFIFSFVYLIGAVY